MTTAAAVTPAPDRLGQWCGWVMVGIVVLTPGLIWLAPLGMAPLMALAGLLCLPAIRMDDEDRPAAVLLFAALIWAAVSTTWSPYHPKNAEGSTILKLALQLPLYWSAICGARRASPALRTLALRVLAWGLAIAGVVMLAETATDGAIYQALHDRFYQPIRPDLAQANLGHSTFVLALLWPLASFGERPRIAPWLSLVLAAGFGSAALAFGSDAPVLALFIAPLVGLAIWRWPDRAPKLFAALAAVLFLVTPAIVWAVRASGEYSQIQHRLPLSWAIRMSYWSHTIDWISDKPLRGWGLDASRMFAPGIELHPHDGALQVWLELGLVGAVTAAAFWGIAMLRLAGSNRSSIRAAIGAATSVYLLFGALNFGIWQEWWLGSGALVVAVAAMLSARTE